MTTNPELALRPFRAAVVQLCSKGVVRANLDRAADLVGQAAADGADLIALPESFAWLNVPGAEPGPAAPLPGPIVLEMAALARKHGCFLLLGGVSVSAPDDPRSYNTSVLLDPEGGTVATYRKRHLFDIDLPGGPTLKESDDYLAGDDIVCPATPLGVLGLSICYDLRFPEHYRACVDRGATVLFVPSAFTARTGRAHWHLLLRARAVENLAYVVAPAQHGYHGGERESYGHSLIVDPWGEVIAEVAEGDGFAAADIDPERLAQVRRGLPALQHRRDVPVSAAETRRGPPPRGELPHHR